MLSRASSTVRTEGLGFPFLVLLPLPIRREGSLGQMGLLLVFKLATSHTFQTDSEEHCEELRSPSAYRRSYFAIGRVYTYSSDLRSGTVAGGKIREVISH